MDTLTEYAFLRRPAHQDPVQPEPAYLLGAVTSPDGSSPEADCVPLIALFTQIADGDGLLSLGNTFSTHTRYRQALDCYEQALSLYKRLIAEEGRQELANDLARALMNKALLLEQREQWSEAFLCYDQAISWRETCLRADMSHVLPELLRTVRYAMMMFLDRQQWEAAAAQVRRVLPWVLPALQAGTLPAPLLREWEQFVGQLRALSQEALEQVYTALGERAEQVRGLLATPGTG